MIEYLASSNVLKPFTVSISNIADLTDPTEWQYDSSLGWYRNRYISNQTTDFPMPVKFNQTVIKRLRKIDGFFTSYYQNPSGALGTSLIQGLASDGKVYAVGTADAWTDNSTGQLINHGVRKGSRDLAEVRNVAERLTLTLPEGVYFTNLTIESHGYYEGGIYYPFTLRGMNDLHFYFE